MWYVIQVRTGKETLIKELIEAWVPKELYEDCKCITRELRRKRHGQMETVKALAFPGYLFIVTDKPVSIMYELKKIPEFTRILGYDGELIPVYEKEEEVLKKLINRDNLIEMSLAVKDGDRIRVVEGALKGQESLITHINRHKMTGYIEIELLGAVRSIPVGLETVEKIG